MKKIICSILLFYGCVSFAQAQGWEKTYVSPLLDTVGNTVIPSSTIASRTIETRDKGFVFAGGSVYRRGLVIGGYRPFVVKTDKNGHLIWQYNAADLLTSDTIKVFEMAVSNFIVMSTDVSRRSLGLSAVLAIKLSKNGIEQARKYYLANQSFIDADITPELDRICVLTNDYYINTALSTASYLLQLTASGDTIRTTFFNNFKLESIVLGTDRQIYVTGYSPRLTAVPRFTEHLPMGQLGV